MSEETNGNGSSGRFLRIEAKLDTLISDLSTFKVDVVQRMVRLETAANLKVSTEVQEVSRRSYRWMKIGIIASFAIGAITLGLRLAGL